MDSKELLEAVDKAAESVARIRLSTLDKLRCCDEQRDSVLKIKLSTTEGTACKG